MQRDEALADFSRDHLPALRQAKYLRKAGTEDGEYSPREAAEGFLEFWNDHAELHFYEEEIVIFPVLSRRGPITEREKIRTMIDDHAWFRDKVVQLEDALEGNNNLKDLVHEMGERLKKHAEMEEQEIFEELQEELTEEELEAIHRRSVNFREQWRPDDIGPRTE
ncbi:MAG: hemerythrin domain-containing protein [bacterium]